MSGRVSPEGTSSTSCTPSSSIASAMPVKPRRELHQLLLHSLFSCSLISPFKEAAPLPSALPEETGAACLEGSWLGLLPTAESRCNKRVHVTCTASSPALTLILSVRGCQQGHDMAIDLFFCLALVDSEVSDILTLCFSSSIPCTL